MFPDEEEAASMITVQLLATGLSWNSHKYYLSPFGCISTDTHFKCQMCKIKPSHP